MNSLQRIPVVGDYVEQGGFGFVVREMKGRRVERVEITELPTRGNPESKPEEPGGSSAPQSDANGLPDRPVAGERKYRATDEDR